MKQNKVVSAFSLFFLCWFLIITGCVPPGGRGRAMIRIPPPPLPPPSKVVHEPEENGPPSWAPAHGHREKRRHMYQYYPDSQVYFAADRGVYFYIDRGNWAMAATLPPSIHIDRNYFMLEYEDDRPYTHHYETVKKYPPGRKEKKHKKYKEKEMKHKRHDDGRGW